MMEEHGGMRGDRGTLMGFTEAGRKECVMRHENDGEIWELIGVEWKRTGKQEGDEMERIWWVTYNGIGGREIKGTEIYDIEMGLVYYGR